MIPALGAGGPGFKSRLSPTLFFLQINKVNQVKIKTWFSKAFLITNRQIFHICCDQSQNFRNFWIERTKIAEKFPILAFGLRNSMPRQYYNTTTGTCSTKSNPNPNVQPSVASSMLKLKISKYISIINYWDLDTSRKSHTWFFDLAMTKIPGSWQSQVQIRNDVVKEDLLLSTSEVSWTNKEIKTLFSPMW